MHVCFYKAKFQHPIQIVTQQKTPESAINKEFQRTFINF